MKKTVLILSAAILTGCALDRQNDYDVEYALEFQPAMYMHVESDGTDGFPSDRTFGVCAWTLPDGESWMDGSRDADLYVPMTQALPEQGSRTWTFGQTVLWPSKHFDATFLAWSPYESCTTCTAQEGVSFSDVNVLEDQTDLLYTDPVADMDKIDCGGVVALPFRHALCSMNFRVKNRVSDDEKIIVRKIELDGARYAGDFTSLSNPQWTLGDDASPFVFFEGNYQTAHQPSEIGQNVLMLPQTLDTPVTVEFDFVTHAGTFITQRLKTTALKKTLEPGKNYTLTLTVGIDDVKFLVEIIEDLLYL